MAQRWRRIILGAAVLLGLIVHRAGAGAPMARAADVTIAIENELMVPRLMIVPQGTTVTRINAGIRVGLMADAPLDPRRWVNLVRQSIEVGNGVFATALPTPAALGTEAEAVALIVEADGQQLRTALVVWQHGPVVAYVMLRTLTGAGDGAGTVPDRNVVAELQQRKLSALLPVSD